jgi:hypothetical protein
VRLEGSGRSLHDAFHVSDAEFDAIFGRVKAKGIAYGSDGDSTSMQNPHYR